MTTANFVVADTIRVEFTARQRILAGRETGDTHLPLLYVGQGETALVPIHTVPIPGAILPSPNGIAHNV
jgi:hypothetical protein